MCAQEGSVKSRNVFLFLLVALLATAPMCFAQPRGISYPNIPITADPKPLFLTHAPDVAQADYTFMRIDPPGGTHCYVDAHAINNARMVVVVWTDDCVSYTTHAWLWNSGKWTSLDWVDRKCPDTGTQFESLTNNGIAFGLYWSISCNYQPAAGLDAKSGRWFVLPNPHGFKFNAGISLSENGRATGSASNSIYYETLTHWIWDGSRYFFPTFPADWDVSAFWAGPEFINNAGQIGGQFVDKAKGLMRGYFQDGSRTTTFDAPGNPTGGTFVNGLTNAGDVLLIGNYDQTSPYYPARSFLWRHGLFTPLPNVPFPEAAWTAVFGVNERGDLTGRWGDAYGGWHVFVAYRNAPEK